MSSPTNRRQKRPIKVDQQARPIVDEATGDTFFEQPLVDDGKNSGPVDDEQQGSKGGKARAKKLGKAKLTAIAERIKRSRRKR